MCSYIYTKEFVLTHSDSCELDDVDASANFSINMNLNVNQVQILLQTIKFLQVHKNVDYCFQDNRYYSHDEIDFVTRIYSKLFIFLSSMIQVGIYIEQAIVNLNSYLLVHANKLEFESLPNLMEININRVENTSKLTKENMVMFVRQVGIYIYIGFSGLIAH